jgi:hypothetical protein
LRATIIFVDEAGFSFRAPVGPTGAPGARPPRLRRRSKRRERSPLVGLTAPGPVFNLPYSHPIPGEPLVPFLHHLRRGLSGPLIVVWARARSPQAQPVPEFLTAHPEIHSELRPP